MRGRISSAVHLAVDANACLMSLAYQLRFRDVDFKTVECLMIRHEGLLKKIKRVIRNKRYQSKFRGRKLDVRCSN